MMVAPPDHDGRGLRQRCGAWRSRRGLTEFPAVVFMLDGILGEPQNSVKRTAGAGSARGIRSSKVEPKRGYPHLGSTLLERIPRALRAPAVRLTEFWGAPRIPSTMKTTAGNSVNPPWRILKKLDVGRLLCERSGYALQLCARARARRVAANIPIHFYGSIRTFGARSG